MIDTVFVLNQPNPWTDPKSYIPLLAIGTAIGVFYMRILHEDSRKEIDKAKTKASIYHLIYTETMGNALRLKIMKDMPIEILKLSSEHMRTASKDSLWHLLMNYGSEPVSAAITLLIIRVYYKFERFNQWHQRVMVNPTQAPNSIGDLAKLEKESLELAALLKQLSKYVPPTPNRVYATWKSFRTWFIKVFHEGRIKDSYWQPSSSLPEQPSP